MPPPEGTAVPTELSTPEEPAAGTPNVIFQFGVMRQPDGLPAAPPVAAKAAAATAASSIAVPESGFASGALQPPRRK